MFPEWSIWGSSQKQQKKTSYFDKTFKCLLKHSVMLCKAELIWQILFISGKTKHEVSSLCFPYAAHTSHESCWRFLLCFHVKGNLRPVQLLWFLTDAPYCNIYSFWNRSFSFLLQAGMILNTMQLIFSVKRIHPCSNSNYPFSYNHICTRNILVFSFWHFLSMEVKNVHLGKSS